MTKRFHRGLVVGKFSPLHRGHEFLIRRAQETCEEVVLISYSNPEYPGCEPANRRTWLSNLFPSAILCVVTSESLKRNPTGGFSEVPLNDAEASIHRQFVGALCSDQLHILVDAVFTSESYGDGFATDLSQRLRHKVEHVLVDVERKEIPISGSALRADVHANRRFLSPFVYSSFVKRICILGGESSGKSTLTAALAKRFETLYVNEYGRDLWEQKDGHLVFPDLLHIAEKQIRMEEEACCAANRYLFCDTSPLTTLFYSDFLFGEVDPQLIALAKRPYDLVVLCAPDFPFVQDGTRRTDSFRDLQHDWYLSQLAQRNIPYLIVTGSPEERIRQATAALISASL